MNKIRKFTLKDVRCFEGKKEFNIRPLTFLVGENSTGKSTVLGCMQALGSCAGLSVRKDFHFDFNADPYQMGAYADIARKIGGRGGRRESFDLGFEIQIGVQETMRLLVTLAERESGSEPTIKQLNLDFEDVSVVFELTGSDKASQSSLLFSDVEGPNKSTAENGNPVYTFKVSDEENLFLALHYFTLHSFTEPANKPIKELNGLLQSIVSRLDDESLPGGLWGFNALLPPYESLRFESFAPIRSKPMRTYDPVREVDDPEGSGMPMTLMNMYRSDKTQWKSMRAKLVKFGKNSGLFADIQIKKHGRSVNDPFQLQIKVRGPQTNIIDVGYGISQILPILVRVFQTHRETGFLIQQPEVHLHPKGQAELCSLLINIAEQHKHSFVIETHSDSMVNRARIEILKKKLNPKDVSLIYLEPVGNKVDVHNISFDDNANMLNVPESYRDFFLKEHDKLLGLGG